MEDYKEMPMTAKEAARAMEWAVEHGHSEKEAIDLVNYITEHKPVNEEEKTKE